MYYENSSPGNENEKNSILKNIALDDVDGKNMYYKNIALDDVDEKKTCIIKTLNLMM